MTTPRHCDTDARQDRDRWLCPICRAWKWVRPRDEENRWRPWSAMTHVGPRRALLDMLSAGELYTRQMANRLGKAESTVKAMLVTMAADGVVTSRFAAIEACPRPVLFWKVTGKPLPDRPTGIECRTVKPHVQAGPAFDFRALVMAMEVKR